MLKLSRYPRSATCGPSLSTYRTARRRNDQGRSWRYLSQELCDTKVYCLIITLPDPVESIASGRFDESLDVVQRAVELQGYILDRTLLPWKPSPPEKGSPAEAQIKVQLPDNKTPITFETTASQPTKTENRPGLMVFKHLVRRESEPPASVTPPSVLLAFLVPESPILGIRRPAFLTSLNLIDGFFRDKLTREGEFGAANEGRQSCSSYRGPVF